MPLPKAPHPATVRRHSSLAVLPSPSGTHHHAAAAAAAATTPHHHAAAAAAASGGKPLSTLLKEEIHRRKPVGTGGEDGNPPPHPIPPPPPPPPVRKHPEPIHSPVKKTAFDSPVATHIEPHDPASSSRLSAHEEAKLLFPSGLASPGNSVVVNVLGGGHHPQGYAPPRQDGYYAGQPQDGYYAGQPQNGYNQAQGGGYAHQAQGYGHQGHHGYEEDGGGAMHGVTCCGCHATMTPYLIGGIGVVALVIGAILLFSNAAAPLSYILAAAGGVVAFVSCCCFVDWTNGNPCSSEAQCCFQIAACVEASLCCCCLWNNNQDPYNYY